MATKAGVGRSQEPDSFEAGVEAARIALGEAEIEKPDLVIVTATIGFDYPQMLEGIRSLTKDATLIGCTGLGIITPEGPDENLRRVAVMVISSDRIRFTPVVGRGLRNDSYAAGKQVADQLRDAWPSDAKALIMLPDGLTINPDALFRGLEENLKEPLPFFGGTSGETMAFKNTYQFFGGEVLEDAIPCVLLSGDFSMDSGVSHGSKPIGVTRTVTKAEGNRIYDIDGKPAFSIFKEFFDEKLEDLVGIAISGVCLGVETPAEARGEYEDVILRIPLALDKSDGSITMAAEWPVGTKIFICRRDPDTIITRAREISQKIRERNGGRTPAFVLHFNCAGRSKAQIGADAARSEIQANRSVFGDGMRDWIGLYTYGEIAPIKGKNYFHNWTSVIFAAFDAE